MNPLTVDGTRYLVAPRGHTQWVRNIRVTGGGELRIGRKVEPFTATEIADEDKPAILRAYLKRWKLEVGVFFDGVDAKAPEEKLREIAPGYPIFRIEPARPPAGQGQGQATPKSAASLSISASSFSSTTCRAGSSRYQRTISRAPARTARPPASPARPT